MRVLLSLAGFLALLALAAPGTAEPLTVEYRIALKPFKKGTAAEDSLQFTLFDDAACTASVHTGGLFASDPALSFQNPKVLKPKGGTTPAKYLVMSAVLDVSPAVVAAPLYLIVTGSGIEPVGDACQVQLSAVDGPEGAEGPAGPAGPTGPVGPTGADGIAGPQGATGAEGSAGATGDVGPQGAIGAMGATGATGAAGPQGAVGAVGATGATGGIGPQGPTGATGGTGATGSFSPPAITHAVFGAGTIVHYTGAHFVLEAPTAASMQLRSTDATFMNFSITHPTGCAAGSSGVGQVFRFTFANAATLTAPFCDVGSTLFVNVYEQSGDRNSSFHCWRTSSNHNSCQRILP
jgi:Collagen triple helix repeat (20 copies)